MAWRWRRGKLHSARLGSVNALSAAPFGYRYVTVQEGGGQARYDVILEEARLVRHIFTWVGQGRVSLQEVCRRLEKQGTLTPTGLGRWNTATIAYLLKNPASKGQAGYGQSRVIDRQPHLRPRRGKPQLPRRPYSVTRIDTQPIAIAVPALVSADLFAAVAEQLAENRRRYRQSRRGASFLLQGLLVCPTCGYAWCGQPRYPKDAQGKKPAQPAGSYRCAGRMMKKTDADRPMCTNKAIHTEALDEAVWRDACLSRLSSRSITCAGLAPGKALAASYSKTASALSKSMLTSLICGICSTTSRKSFSRSFMKRPVT